MANERLASALGDKFGFTITNTTGTSKTLALIPANFQTLALTEGAPNTISYKSGAEIAAAGITCDYALDDGTLVANLTATANIPEFKIREFLQEIKLMGRVCKSITIQSASSDVFNGSFKIYKRTSLQGSSPKYLQFNTYRSVDQTATDKIVMTNLNLEFMADTLLMYTIDTGKTVSITYEFGN